jgi:hypothetical protein
MNIDAHARAIALRERARHAIDRSRELARRTATSQARLAKVQADLVATRRARLAQRAADAGVPWAASGRVVRRPARRRGAAACEASDGASDGGDDEPPQHRRGARIWAHAPVLAERAVYDGYGEEWLVRELDATGLPGARRPRCLIFENHHVVRRVWHYPGDWQMISDATLLALSKEKV